MTNKLPSNPITSAPGQRTTASLMVGAALTVLSLSAFAEQPGSGVTQAPPQMAITQAAAGPAATVSPAASAESLQTPKVQAFESAPSLPTSLPGTAKVTEQGAVPGQGAVDLTARLAAADDVPWVLDPDIRPWTLAYNELMPLNALFLSLPSEKEARIMLPGYSADAADRARFIVNRYVTDNIGGAAQIRGRQFESFNRWAENTAKQKLALPKDPWAAYQFSKESLATLKVFKQKIQSQTEPTIQRMAQDVQAAVGQVSPVMSVMPSYEQKMQWYNVLVQLKEGVGLYQARVQEADKQILDAIAAFESANPPAARPLGSPPPRPNIEGGRTAVVMPGNDNAPSLTPEAPRERAQAPVTKRDEPSQMGGILVVLGMVAVVFGMFMKLRKRVSKKETKADS